MIRVRLEGDHSAYHCGSAAVWRAMIRAVQGQGAEVVQDDDYDLMIVNGEGSMHHDRTTFRKKMQCLRTALESGRRASLVNTVWQENSGDFDDVLKALDVIVVREVRSQRDLFERHGIESWVRPDLCYFADEPRPADPPSGRRVATDFYVREFGNFARVTGGPIAALPYIDMKAVGWSALLEQLAAGPTLVTGRHHAVYAACRARAPFISTAGNSHKIEGLLESAGVDGLIMASPAEALAASEGAHVRHAEAYAQLHAWLDSFKLRDVVPLR